MRFRLLFGYYLQGYDPQVLFFLSSFFSASSPCSHARCASLPLLLRPSLAFLVWPSRPKVAANTPSEKLKKLQEVLKAFAESKDKAEGTAVVAFVLLLQVDFFDGRVDDENHDITVVFNEVDKGCSHRY